MWQWDKLPACMYSPMRSWWETGNLIAVALMQGESALMVMGMLAHSQ